MIENLRAHMMELIGGPHDGLAIESNNAPGIDHITFPRFGCGGLRYDLYQITDRDEDGWPTVARFERTMR